MDNKVVKDASGWSHANGVMWTLIKFVRWTEGLISPDIRPSQDGYIACMDCGKGPEDHGEYTRDGRTHSLCPGDYLIEGIVRKDKS